MPGEGTALAPAGTSAVTLGGPMPEGFENLEAADLVVPRIRLWHPQSDISPDGVKMGDYVDLMAKAAIGPELQFFILAQKTVQYENDRDGVKTIKDEKQLLSVLLGNSQFPRRIEFSAGGLREAKRLISQLFVASQAQGNKPLYAWLIKATSENLVNKDSGGKYAAPKLDVAREATGEELAALKSMYAQFAPDFLKHKDAPVDTAAAMTAEKGDGIPLGKTA